MNYELKTITPETAKRMLGLNVGNRAINKRHVDSLAREMQNGRWKINGDTICLNGSKLIDGQHRLHAVVQSGVTIKSLVVEDLPSDVFDTKDVGKRRSAGDTLSVLGKRNANRLAAALVMVDKYMTGRADRNVQYSNTEVELLLGKYPDLEDHIVTSISGRMLLTPAVLDSCFYIFSRIDRDLANDFVNSVMRGVGLIEGTAWYVLRERLINNSLSKAKLPKSYMMALCIKAWNFQRVNKRVTYLRWVDSGKGAEAFPVAK